MLPARDISQGVAGFYLCLSKFLFRKRVDAGYYVWYEREKGALCRWLLVSSTDIHRTTKTLNQIMPIHESEINWKGCRAQQIDSISAYLLLGYLLIYAEHHPKNERNAYISFTERLHISDNRAIESSCIKQYDVDVFLSWPKEQIKCRLCKDDP